MTDKSANFSLILEKPNITWNLSSIVDKNITQHILHKTLNHYVEEYCKNNTAYIVSLSGGVDSMVLISILWLIRANSLKSCESIEIVGLHLNYKNRDETDLEQKFLEHWCRHNNINLICYGMEELRRSVTDREYYEKETKRIRFEQYGKVLQKFSSSGIFLAHHKGDEQENTFSNIINGKGLLSLSAMQEITTIEGIGILRPLINLPKQDIYDFAHMYGIPYFKDTTPDWSNRGKLRNKLFPSMEEIYGKKYLLNFTNLSKESRQWKDMINNMIIQPFIQTNVTFVTNPTTNNIEHHIILTTKYPFCFWDTLLKSLKIMIAKKATSTLVHKIDMNFTGKIPLNKQYWAELTCSNLIIKINKS